KNQAVVERNEKDRALVRADGLRLSAEAAAVLPTDPTLAVILAYEGAQRAPSHLTFNTLYDAAASSRELRRFAPPGQKVRHVRSSADGRLIVVAGDPAGQSAVQTFDPTDGHHVR